MARILHRHHPDDGDRHLDYEGHLLMAGVKTQRGGPSVGPIWHPQSCGACDLMIEEHIDPKKKVYPAQRVMVIAYTGTKANSRYEWRHKACVK